MDIQKNTFALISFILIIIILYFGKSILTPIVGAFLAWFIIKEMLYYIDKIKFGKVKIPRFIQITLAFAIVFFTLFFIGNILGHNAESIQRNLPKYQQNLNEIIANNSLLQRFNINDFFLKSIEKINFASLVGTAINSLSSMFSSAVLVVLYLVFIFLESGTFKQKIDAIYSNADEQSKVENILNTIDFSLSKYLSLKTLTSALTGVLSFIVLSIIGVDFAVFWAFLIFLLNFIPNIGSMIATAFPAIMALVQSGNLVMPLIVLIGVGAVQLLVGNFIEPRLMGNSLNVSPLVVLIALVFWGWLWGIFGMIMSVPITNMIIIVCAQFKETKWIAILLSSDGNLPKSKKRV